MYYVTASCFADKTKSESPITSIPVHRQYLVRAEYFHICTRHLNNVTFCASSLSVQYSINQLPRSHSLLISSVSANMVTRRRGRLQHVVVLHPPSTSAPRQRRQLPEALSEFVNNPLRCHHLQPTNSLLSKNPLSVFFSA